MLQSWLHLTALVIYIGSLTNLWLVLLPALSTIKSHEQRLLLLARSLKLYNPLQIGVLGVLVLTGAFQITDLKSAYRELFIKELGMTLGWKLVVSFVLILLSTYQSMGVAHRFVRRYEGGDGFSAEEIRSLSQRLRISTVLVLPLALIAVWLGLRLRGG
jgi:uncharacterized membrane protein